jgi:nitrate reductase gamma subunit
MTSLNSFLFVALPYIAIFVFFVATIRRYISAKFGISSLSSQFLEGNAGFWGTVPFHLGILLLLLGHLAMFLIPDAVLAWNSDPVRLLIHEGVMFTFGLVVFVALAGLLVRRWLNPRLRAVTSRMDVVIEVLLLAQIVLGCWTALEFRWGSSWFAADLTPYLWSILSLDPQIAVVSVMPVVIKLHIVGAFLIVLLVPFTRLVHLLVAPIHYLWRPYQVVMWHWDRKLIRQPGTAWQSSRPRNN